MRAISPFARYSIVLQHPVLRRGVDKTGTVVEYEDGTPLIAQFEVSGLTAWEEIEAMEHFGDTLSGLPEGVNPLTRISVFDSELYVQRYPEPARKEALEFIDAQLADKAAQYPSHFRVVAIPAAAKPWASYDGQDLEQILETLVATGTDPSVAVRYEKENLGRVEVIEALETFGQEAEASQESISVAL